MTSFWTDACRYAEKKSLQERLDSAHGSCGTTVTAALHRCRPRLLRPFLLAAAVCDCCSDNRILRKRSCKRRLVLSLVADWRGGTAECLAAVRMVQRADVFWQLLRGCDLGSLDAEPLQRFHSRIEPISLASSACIVLGTFRPLERRLQDNVRD